MVLLYIYSNATRRNITRVTNEFEYDLILFFFVSTRAPIVYFLFLSHRCKCNIHVCDCIGSKGMTIVYKSKKTISYIIIWWYIVLKQYIQVRTPLEFSYRTRLVRLHLNLLANTRRFLCDISQTQSVGPFVLSVEISADPRRVVQLTNHDPHAVA